MDRTMSLVKSMTAYVIHVIYDIIELKLLPVKKFWTKVKKSSNIKYEQMLQNFISKRETGR